MVDFVFTRFGRAAGLFAVALLLVAAPMAAQTGTITGTVRSAVTGDPLEGARVTLDGTQLVGRTDGSGRYTISGVTTGIYSVRVQMIGYQTVILSNQRVQPGTPTVTDFNLNASVLRLEGVVVTGVAEETEIVKLPFTVDQVTAADLPVLPQGTPEEAIRGKVAGAKIVRTNGEPGGGVSVLLRGATSINVGGRSNEPLYVVDGVILGSSMVDIDAMDIASIEVLKGAAASSAYGSRAANGVIQIRTNRGRNMSEGDTRITFGTEVGQNYLGNTRVDLARHHNYYMDVNGTCQVPISPIPGETGMKRGTCWTDAVGTPVLRNNRVEEAPFGVGGFLDNEYQGELFDHLDTFFSPGSFSTQRGTIAHREGSSNFSATVARSKEGGIIQGLEGYERKSVRVNLDHSLAQDLEMSISGFYSNSTSDGNPNDPNANTPNPFFGLMFLEADNDILQPNADGTPFIIQPDPNSLEENPLYAINNQEFQQRRSRTLGNFRLRWFPDAIEGFDLEADFSFDRSDRNRFEYYFIGFKTIDPATINDGQVDRNNAFDQAINASLTARYRRQFGDLASTTSARVLIERSEFEQFFASARDLLVNNVNDLSVGTTTSSSINSASQDVRSLGYFISQDLDIKDRYIISAVVRRDGSSLFGVDERWHTYYRLGGAYRVSQESWFPLGGIFDEFKLRASRGTAGGRPQFSAQYETFQVGGGQVQKNVLGNTTLKPEFATEDEFGIDMIIGGRIQSTLTYAHSVVENQILNAPLPAFFGFTSQWQNAGTLDSKTFEASLSASLVSSANFGWDAGIIYDRTRQRITEFPIPPYRFGSVFYNREGEDFGTMYGLRFITDCSQVPTSSCDGWDLNDEGYLVPVGSGNSYRDGISGSLWGTTVTGDDGMDRSWGFPVAQDSTLADGTTTSDFLRIGNTTPDFNLGFTNTFRWGNLSVYTLFDAQIGGDVYNGTKQWSYRDQRHGDNDQFGKSDELKKPAFYARALYATNNSASHFVEDATYLKFRELSLRYSLGAGALQGIMGGFLNRVTISAIGRNLYTWTDYTGFDPEVGQNGSNAAIERRDQFNYPNYRTFTGSFEIQF